MTYQSTCTIMLTIGQNMERNDSAPLMEFMLGAIQDVVYNMCSDQVSD